MQLGMIGLGRMGANMVRRLQKNGHHCVVFDRTPATVQQLVSEGATGSTSFDDFVQKLQKPRAAKNNPHADESDDGDQDPASSDQSAVTQRLDRLERLVQEMSDRLKSMETRVPPQKKDHD